MRLLDILNKIESEKKDQVNEICQTWRRVVQEKLLDMIKLSLGGARIVFEVSAAYPPQFRDIVLSDDEYQEFLLYQNKPTFTRLSNDTDLVSRIIPQVEGILYRDKPQQLRTDLTAMSEVRTIGNRLLARSPKADDFIRQLQKASSHIFGIYRGSTSSGQIQLYWAVIALFSARWDIDLEALVLVVLSHEYAHAYTHLCVDGNGRRWETANFQSTSPFIIEGLAEYLSERFVKQVSGYHKTWNEAYDFLLLNSPEEYKGFKQWDNPSPEAIRFAMLHARRSSMEPIGYEEFKSLIREGKNRFEN